MKSGYKIHWTANALNELKYTLDYLEENFTKKEIKKLAAKIESTTSLISQNPFIFPKSENHLVFKVVILKFNTLYYRINDNHVEILSFFSNRQHPKKRKL